jgi:hypothetical protein
MHHSLHLNLNRHHESRARVKKSAVGGSCQGEAFRAKFPPFSAALFLGRYSGKARGSPVFPVSRFRDGLPGNAKQAANPHG